MEQSEELKRAVGYRAAGYIEDGMVVGLGTGSTVRHLLDAIAERRARGELGQIVGIATSDDTSKRASALGIALGTLDEHPELDLALDGADEVDEGLDLIKGLGGALLREKIVVSAADRFIVLVDASKLVKRLGTRGPLPVEIDPFSLGVQMGFLRGLGCRPELRRARDGSGYLTDGGHMVIDCHFIDGIVDPVGLAATLDSRAGVMEHGLFLDVASMVIVARPEGCEELKP